VDYTQVYCARGDSENVPRLRQALITIGVQVVRSVRRIVRISRAPIPTLHVDAFCPRARRGARVNNTATTRLRAGGVAADARSERAAPAGLTNHAVQAAAAHSCDLNPRQRYPEALAVAETILRSLDP
jgi:hypothetical protein